MGEHSETFGTLVSQLYLHGDLVGIIILMERFDPSASGRWRGQYHVEPLVHENAGSTTALQETGSGATRPP